MHANQRSVDSLPRLLLRDAGLRLAGLGLDILHLCLAPFATKNHAVSMWMAEQYDAIAHNNKDLAGRYEAGMKRSKR